MTDIVINILIGLCVMLLVVIAITAVWAAVVSLAEFLFGNDERVKWWQYALITLFYAVVIGAAWFFGSLIRNGTGPS